MLVCIETVCGLGPIVRQRLLINHEMEYQCGCSGNACLFLSRAFYERFVGERRGCYTYHDKGTCLARLGPTG